MLPEPLLVSLKYFCKLRDSKVISLSNCVDPKSLKSKICIAILPYWACSASSFNLYFWHGTRLSKFKVLRVYLYSLGTPMLVKVGVGVDVGKIVGVILGVTLMVGVTVGVAGTVPVIDGVIVIVGVTVGVAGMVAVGVAVTLAVGVTGGVALTVGVNVGVGVTVGVGVGEAGGNTCAVVVDKSYTLSVVWPLLPSKCTYKKCLKMSKCQ